MHQSDFHFAWTPVNTNNEEHVYKWPKVNSNRFEISHYFEKSLVYMAISQ